MDVRSIVIKTYVNLIKKGNMTLSEVPQRCREEVRVALMGEK